MKFHPKSPTRRLNKVDSKLASDMLGAGTDPLSRKGEFSVLA